jgi:hypothetical protein
MYHPLDRTGGSSRVLLAGGEIRLRTSYAQFTAVPLDEPLVTNTITITRSTPPIPSAIATFERDLRLLEEPRHCEKPKTMALAAKRRASVGIQKLVSSPKIPRTTRRPRR